MEALRVIKKSGVTESFKLDKLTKSVHLAMSSAGINDPSAVSGIMDELMSEILRITDKLTTSKIADLVEKTFISKVVIDPRYELAARYYLLARIYNDVYGKNAWTEFTPEDSRLSYYSLRVLSSRYLLRDPSSGRYIETPKKLFERVAKHIASAETKDHEKWFNEFFKLISELRFLPNSPTLMNAGTRLGILSACFVLPVRDSMVTPEGEGIYDAVRAQAIVFQQGGGTGFSFSELRPEGDVVSTTASVASGPLSFMKLFDVNTDVVKQGGRRRGANMGTLHVWHPDIMKFIKSKSGELKDKALQNFNISVGVYDWFFKHLAENAPVPLINPRKTSVDGTNDSRKYAVVWARHYMSEEWVQEVILDELEEYGGSIPLDKSVIITWDEALAIAEREKAIVGWEDPKTIFQEIVKSAWDSGDPGLLFIDTINRRHPTWYLGKINATNPCVAGDTRILTPHGWKRIKDLFEEAKHGKKAVSVVADGGVLGDGGEPVAYATEILAPVAGGTTYETLLGNELRLVKALPAEAWVWHVGKKDGVKIETVEGFEIIVTPEHRLLTLCGWKHAKELRPGDKIALMRPYPFGQSFGIDIDSDIAFALGWLIGGGALNKHYVVWHLKSKDEKAIKRIRKAIEKLGGSADHYVAFHSNSSRIQFSKTSEVYKKIIEIAGDLLSGSQKHTLPKVVWAMSPKSLIDFLKGLFTARGVISDCEALRLNSSSLRLLKEIQILLLSLGVVSSIRKRTRKRGSRPIAEGSKGETYAGSNYYELVIKDSSRTLCAELIELESSGELYRPSLTKTREDSSWVTVKSVSSAGKVDFYDLTVPGINAYVANGIINHNCGEEPLLEWESCNLGSINLEKYVVYVDGKPTIDWVRLSHDVRVAVRFLDNVIDVAKWPLPQLEKAAKRTRKVGLGVMGWAHMLIKLGIPFDSVDALYLAYYLSEWIAYNAYEASVELAAEKGTFPAWNPKLYRPFWLTAKSLNELLEIAGVEPKISDRVKMLVKMRPQVDWNKLHEKMTKHGLRNAALLSIAPTGTISIIAGTSSSIEPIFALAFTRVVTVGTFIEVNQLFLEALREYGLDDPEVINLIAESGSIRHNPYMPRKLKEIFVTAHDIDPLWHVLHQAIWQQWVDAGVSKTVNMRAEASVDEVRNVYLLAWRLGCKGITIYRDRSKTQQVIYFGAKLTRRMAREKRVEGTTEVLPETTHKEGEAVESVSKTTEAAPETEKRAQVKYRIATRYALQEGESGGCFTCEY